MLNDFIAKSLLEFPRREPQADPAWPPERIAEAVQSARRALNNEHYDLSWRQCLLIGKALAQLRDQGVPAHVAIEIVRSEFAKFPPAWWRQGRRP